MGAAGSTANSKLDIAEDASSNFSGSASEKASAKYLAKRPGYIDTSQLQENEEKDDDVDEIEDDLPHIEPVPGGNEETALVLARAKMLLRESWTAEVAEKMNIVQHKDSISPKKRRSSNRSPIMKASSSPFSPLPSSPFAKSPTEASKAQLMESLSMNSPYDILVTPTAIVLYFQASGRGPNDFQSVDGYNVQWIVEPEEPDEAFLTQGDTTYMKLKSAKRSVHEIAAWSAPGSIRSGLAPLHFQANSRDWSDIPRRCIRIFDKMVVIQGLNPQSYGLRFRVRASKNSIWGAFSPISRCIRTSPSVRQSAPKLQKSASAAAPLGVEVTWEPMRHYIDGIDAVYFLFAKDGGKESVVPDDDPFDTMNLIYSGRHCSFIAGGEGEERLSGNTVYQFRVSVCWKDIDGSKHFIHSGISEIKTSVTPPPSKPRSVLFSESKEGPCSTLTISWSAPPGEGYAYSSGEGLIYQLYGSCPADDTLRKSIFESSETTRISTSYALYYSGPDTCIVLGNIHDETAPCF